jgi:hypothetical protein
MGGARHCRASAKPDGHTLRLSANIVYTRHHGANPGGRANAIL